MVYMLVKWIIQLPVCSVWLWILIVLGWILISYFVVHRVTQTAPWTGCGRRRRLRSSSRSYM